MDKEDGSCNTEGCVKERTKTLIHDAARKHPTQALPFSNSSSLLNLEKKLTQNEPYPNR
jgi:hypothetical protein